MLGYNLHVDSSTAKDDAEMALSVKGQSYQCVEHQVELLVLPMVLKDFPVLLAI